MITGGWKLLRAAIPYIILAAIIFGALLFAYDFGVGTERARKDAEISALKLKHATTLGQIDREHRTQLDAARLLVIATERKAADEMAAMDMKFTKELNDAKHKAAADVAAVRAGAWRVRDEFTCSAPGDAGPSGGAAAPHASAGVDHGAAQRGLRSEDAAEIIEAADTGDRWAVQLRACQAIIRRDRQ